MSPINFEPIAKLHPEYRTLLADLAMWLAKRAMGFKRERMPTIDPRDLAKAWPNVDRMDLSLLLHLLVQAGAFRTVYKVITPSGVMADGEFDDPRQIPEKLPDRFNEYFDTSEADVVPILKPVER
jgi:hypothetical protein